MIGSVVAKRYASALFALGKEGGASELERFGVNLEDLANALTVSPQLAEVFKNPVLSITEKKHVLKALLEKMGVADAVRRFCELLADKGRLPILRDIAAAYSTLLDDFSGISRGVFTGAFALDEGRKANILDQLEKKTGRKLVLEFKEDAALLGGFVLKLGDLQLDASVRTQIENLRESIKRGE